MSEPTASTWLTVAEAAAALKVSPRTIRRRCESGELVAELEAGESGTGGRAWRIDAADVAAKADGQTDKRTVAARSDGQAEDGRADRQTDTNQAQNVTARPDGQARGQTANTADGHGRAARWTSARPDGQEIVTALMAEKDARIADLQAQIEAQRLQIEAANRNAAEANAALREALKMSHRALNEGSHTPVTQPSQSAPQVLAEPNVGPELGEIRGQNSEMDKEARQPQSASNSPNSEAQRPASIGRDSKGLRGWLLRILRA